MKRTLTLGLLIALLAACGGAKSATEGESTGGVAEQPTEPAETPPESTGEGALEEEEGEKLPPPEDVAAPPAAAERSDSGLAWIILEPGDGAGSPTVDNTIKVHYTGWTTDGEMFDSSVVREEPIEFPLGKLIGGWQEGIPMMSRGEKRRFWIPGELAYANSNRPGAPQGLLVFDIELIDYH